MQPVDAKDYVEQLPIEPCLSVEVLYENGQARIRARQVMRIRRVGGLAVGRMNDEIAAGGRFVRFTWVISFFSTFECHSPTYFARSTEDLRWRHRLFTCLTVLLGWWGPWGPSVSLAALKSNRNGGKDMTGWVPGALAAAAAEKWSEGNSLETLLRVSGRA